MRIQVVEGQICLMVYQVADNGLEAYMQQDYVQLSKSPLVSRESVRTWIYHDAGELDNGFVGALPNTLDRQGHALLSNQPKYTGSQYIRYNHALRQLQVDTTLPEEVNSLSVEVIQTFLEHALGDCITNGYDQLMAIFSSHAGGFIGFGEDRHPYAPPLTNHGIATAISNALQNTVGAPTKLDVLGFDACNMMAFGAVDDYVNVTNYFLASEAEEPGHGWHYDSLDQSLSSVDLSKQIVHDFLRKTDSNNQGPSTHATPKTLAIVETSKYQPFVDAFEILCSDLLSALTKAKTRKPNGQHHNGGGDDVDVSLHAFVSRARQSAIAYHGPMNSIGSPNPTCLDIGSFLRQLSTLCNPMGDVAVSLQRAYDAYNAMFVERGNGPGTSPGTGMHILWPTQGDYILPEMKIEYDQALFENDNYIATNAPNFRALLEWLLHTSSPTIVGEESGGSSSVCSTGAVPTTTVTQIPLQQGAAADDDNNKDKEEALILADTMTIDSTTNAIQIDAVISPSVTHMLVDYSISFSPSLKPVLMERGFQPNDDDYLMLKGGEVTGSYEGSTFASTWDQSFYFLNTTQIIETNDSGESSTNTTYSNSLEALYVKDEGDTKWVPVIYFPKNMTDTISNFQLQDYLQFDFDYYIRGGGGAQYAYLAFSKSSDTGEINQNLALYVSHGDVFHEQPREAGGFLLPLILVDGYLQGKRVDRLVGGFNQTIIEWSTSFNYGIIQTSASEVAKFIPGADAVVVNLYAYNAAANPSRDPDIRRYGVVDKNRGAALPMDDPESNSKNSKPSYYLRGEPAEEETIRFAAAPSYHASSAINAFHSGGFHAIVALAAAAVIPIIL